MCRLIRDNNINFPFSSFGFVERDNAGAKYTSLCFDSGVSGSGGATFSGSNAALSGFPTDARNNIGPVRPGVGRVARANPMTAGCASPRSNGGTVLNRKLNFE